MFIKPLDIGIIHSGYNSNLIITKESPSNLRIKKKNLNFIELVDQDALVKALQENRIRGAGLDVMTPEPLPVDHPLVGLDNVCEYIFTHFGVYTLLLGY